MPICHLTNQWCDLPEVAVNIRLLQRFHGRLSVGQKLDCRTECSPACTTLRHGLVRQQKLDGLLT